jgi:hypothetical protein
MRFGTLSPIVVRQPAVAMRWKASAGPEQLGALIHSGAAHLQGLPHIEVNGDSAVVTAYSQLVLREEGSDSYRIWRTGVNRWEFCRTAEGWQVTQRINRQLDGGAEVRELLRDAIDVTPV